MTRVIATCLAAAALAGCNSAEGRRRALQSSDPVQRARAVVQVAEARDLEAVHKLVDLLEDPDRAVRMYAALALRDLCDQDFGYRYYASPAERAVAVERWREALRNAEVVVHGRRPPPPDDSPGPADGGGAAQALSQREIDSP
ncbi:hypothetical protein RAS1_25200 [Phycisphaerae bacterium RAS1]|nr:hypothetical protein RAS1_25200 [Phycisphaerae bacterium RAS1]